MVPSVCALRPDRWPGRIGYNDRMPLTLAVTVLSAALSLAAPATLKYDIPQGWVSAPPSSSMRVAEFTLPRAAGDAADAALVIYYFQGGGGSVQANIDRWIQQMEAPGGRPAKDLAKTSEMQSHGLTITLLDASGTYTAEMSPGSAEHHDNANYRMRAAVVETSAGPYFIKLTGPQKTVAKWDASFMAFIKSLRFD